ncbi:hypothetical protein RSAG8_12895, partial [Rhizoctonia solani AG-8 WAC10335]
MNVPPPLITGAMPAEQILALLSSRGCEDITSELDLSNTSIVPVTSGGNGSIYLGKLQNGTRVAIKTLQITAAPVEEEQKKLRRAAHELYIWRKCNHPNILELFGVAVFHGRVCMVSPWIEHSNLLFFLSRNPQVDRYALCAQIAEGVVHMHENNIVHGDIKGGNILISQDRTAKIMDFGSSVLKQEYTLKFQTTTGQPVISLRWAAPELIPKNGEEVKLTLETDIYALGMTFYEVMSGQVPYYEVVRDFSVMSRITQYVLPTRPEQGMVKGDKRADSLWRLMGDTWALKPQDRPTADTILNRINTIYSLALLTEFGCKDISDQLKQGEDSRSPVSTDGTGCLYKGRLNDQTKVAIKCLGLKIGSSEESLKDLKFAAREVHAWSIYHHPNILELTGLAVFNDQVAMVSPWMEGGTVTWFVSQNPQVDRHTLCTQIGEGVAYLHSNYFVHGDLKAANILMSKNGTPKITGFGAFGVEKYIPKFDEKTDWAKTRLRWAAPELVNEESALTRQADIYALGMTYLEIITGSEPYYGVPEHAIKQKIREGANPTRPEKEMPIGSAQHDRIWSLMKSCWAYDPRDRPTADKVKLALIGPREPNYESMSDVLEVLRTFGFKDYTSMLNASEVTPVDPGKHVDCDMFQVKTVGPRGIIAQTFRCPRDSYFEGRKRALRSTVRELYTRSKCDHPYIRQVFGVAEYDGRLAIISPPSTGYHHLEPYLSSHFEGDHFLLCIQVAETVDFLHSQGIIHGSLHMLSVLVSENGTPLLIDFRNSVLESASPLFPRDPHHEPYDHADFDAPERYLYQNVPTKEADIWALGTVILEIMVGKSLKDLGPASGSISDRTYEHIPTRPVSPVLEDQRGKRLWGLLRTCWNDKPEKRPTAERVVKKLTKIACMPSTRTGFMTRFPRGVFAVLARSLTK